MTQSSSEALESEKKGPPPDEPHGGDGHDDHHEDPIHADNPFLQHHFDTPQQQFDAGKLGIWLFLVTEVLFFAGLFCAYAVYRAQHPEIFNYAHYYLDTNLGALNTIVLILSSLTAAWSVRNAQLGQKKKLIVNIVITLACAGTFLVVKYVEYSHKVHDGLLWGKKFDPTHEVWELDAFEKKHPEAARLVKKIQAGGSTRASTAQVVPPVVAADAETATDTAAADTAKPAAQPAKPAAKEPDKAAAEGTAAAGDDAETEEAKTAADDEAAAKEGDEAAQTETAAAGEAAGDEAAAKEGEAAAPAAKDEAAAPAEETAAAKDDQAADEAAEAPAPPAEAKPALAAAGEEPAKEGVDPVLAAVAAEQAAPVVRGRSQSDLEAAIKPLVDGGMLNEEGTVVRRPANVHIFFGIYFFMTGLHGIHVLGGIIVWIWLLTRAIKGHFGPRYFGPIDYAALYWHLVDLIWIYLFPLLYLIH